jgi:hypothetical protein
MAVTTPMPLGLESPDVVAVINPGDKLGLGEFGEVAVDRGPVETAVIERCGDLGMRFRARGGEHVLQDCQSGRGAPQPCPADEALDGINRSRFRRFHSSILTYGN